MWRFLSSRVYWRKPVLSDGVGEEVVVVAYFEDAEGEEGMAFGECVEVEEDLLGGILRGLAAMDGVLLALDGARVVFKAAEGIGYAEVGLQDAAEHFVIELFLEGLGGLQVGGGVIVFRGEIGENAGIFFVAEPCVVVDAAVVVDDVLDGFAKGEGRLEIGGAGLGGGWGVVLPGIGGEIGGSRVEFGSHGR